MTELVEKLNPLIQTLRQRIPGETFRLPSQGLFYTNRELADDVTNGEVHVYPLTAIDEVTLKSPDTLMSGKAIETVFRKCIPQVLQPLQLLSKDVDYLLMCLRLLSYGASVPMMYQHDCDNAKTNKYDIELRPIIAAAAPIDPTTVGESFTVKLANDQVIKMRPAIFGSVMQMYQAMAFENTQDPSYLLIQQQTLIDVVADMIVSVDNVNDKDNIHEWLVAVPAGYLSVLAAAADKVSHWGPDLLVHAACKDCGETIDIELPINPVSFFS